MPTEPEPEPAPVEPPPAPTTPEPTPTTPEPAPEPPIVLPEPTAPGAGGGEGGPVAAVPVPAAVWLFGTGLIGLTGMSRRKKK